MKHILSLALVSGLTITAGLTAQQLPSTVVFTNTPGVPASIAPGTGGFAFNLGTGTASAFTGIPVVSPTGAFWAIEAVLEGPATTADEVYLVNGTAFLIEGTPDPTDPAFNVGFLDSQIAINDLGEVVATFDTTAATTADEVAIYFNAGGVPTLLGRQGDPIAFLPGVSYGGTMDSANITSTGDIGFASDFGAGTDLLLRGTTAAGMTTVVARDLDAATAPTGLAGGATDQWENFDFNAYLISDDGLTVVIQGDTNGGTTADDILTVNGAVLLQENVVFGTFATGVTTIGWRVLDPLGNLIVRGENSDGLDWVIRNGTVVAQTGDPVVTGSTELLFDGTGGFADTFFSIGGNLAGQIVFGGRPTSPTRSATRSTSSTTASATAASSRARTTRSTSTATACSTTTASSTPSATTTSPSASRKPASSSTSRTAATSPATTPSSRSRSVVRSRASTPRARPPRWRRRSRSHSSAKPLRASVP
jgi:hypothetical protein